MQKKKTGGSNPPQTASRPQRLPRKVKQEPVMSEPVAREVEPATATNIDPRLVLCTVENLAAYIQAVRTACVEAGTSLWFRGITKHSHRLVPSLFRGFSNLSEQELRQREAALNRRFRDRSMPFSLQGRDESADTSPLQSWWRLFTMQHYGVPTRLLDWSENAITALCFAVFENSTDTEHNAVVWLLNPGEWNRRGNINMRAAVSVDDHLAEPYAPLPSNLQHLETNWPLAVFGMHNNPRIVMQQGTFIVFAPGRCQPMEDHALASQNGESPPLRAIIIPRSVVKSIATDLRSLGFVTSSLYPDLGGLASDLKTDFGY